MPTSAPTIICNNSTGIVCLLKPFSFQHTVFSLHLLANPRVQLAQCLFTARWTWPSISATVSNIKNPLTHHYANLHICKPWCTLHQHPHWHCGCFSLSNGSTYDLTCIDWFTHWPEDIFPVATSHLRQWQRKIHVRHDLSTCTRLCAT